MSDFRPGDRVRALGPGLEDWDDPHGALIAGREAVVTVGKREGFNFYGVVIYDERGDLIPRFRFGWDPAEFDDDEWPLDRYHRCVWLLTDGELEQIEEMEDAA